jgi:hypothetical protein
MSFKAVLAGNQQKAAARIYWGKFTPEALIISVQVLKN